MTAQGGISIEVQMKFNNKGPQLESKIVTKWKKVGDTNLGHVDLKDFKKRRRRNILEDYKPMTVDLSPATKEQEVQDIQERLRKAEEKKKQSK